MIWYSIIKFAGTKEEYLRSLNIPEEVINYILSAQDAKIQQYLINAARQNPQISIEELKNIWIKAMQPKQVVNPYLTTVIPQMLSRIRHNWTSQKQKDIFEKWVTEQLFKKFQLRGKTVIDPITVNEITDIVINNMFLVTDWFERLEDVGLSIFNYTIDESLEETRKFHETGNMTDGDFDKTSAENIVYGPQWIDEKGNAIPQYQGWTIQKVISENDLEVEGDKMDHCVGGYCNKVKNKQSIIYSLRDPQNEPHVTIETDGSGETAWQIFGKSNSEPKPEYKMMIRYWIKSGQNAPQINADEENEDILYDITYSSWRGYIREFSEELEKAVEERISKEDEYGFKQPPISIGEVEHVFEQSYNAVNALSSYGYGGDRNISDDLVKLAIEGGKDALEYLFELMQKKEESYDYIDTGLPYPQEEDYEDKEEYEKAIEEFEQQEQDIIDESFPFGWFADIYKEVRHQLERNYHITLEDFLKQENPSIQTTAQSKNWYKNIKD